MIVSDLYLSELAKTAMETGDFTKLDKIASNELAQAQKAWEPYKKADENWKKWNALPRIVRLFVRKPDCEGGAYRCRAAEQVMWMKSLTGAIQQKDVRRFIMK